MKNFETIKHYNNNGVEFWTARELQEVLEYKEWRNFHKVIERAMIACETSGNRIATHFVEVNKMVELGLGTVRELKDFHMSRYACYLIVQNGDPNKEIIALGQTYFALRTRQQELTEDEQRLNIRHQLTEHNKSLAEAAHNAGVDNKDFGTFQNHGYRGLYGGLTAKDIHTRKNLKPSQKILDHMGATELAANLFRATQTDEKLRRENIQGKDNANKIHFEVGQIVRNTIKELGGTMPEDLPTPSKSIKQLQKEQKKQNNKLKE